MKLRKQVRIHVPIAVSHRRVPSHIIGSSAAPEAKSNTSNPPTTVQHVGGLFFPVAGSIGLPARATITPKLTEKIVWAGGNLGSYSMAEEGVSKLSEQNISATRIRRQVQRVGEARLAEREEEVAKLKTIDLPSRREGRSHQAAPQVGVVMMDGGRYQRRDHFANRGEPKNHGHSSDPKTHWRETKVGCLLSMTSDVHADDPCPQIPDAFVHAQVVQQIAKMGANTVANEQPTPSDALINSVSESSSNGAVYKPPKLESRDIVASGENAAEFGWQLESRALRLNFPSSQRQAFIADGAQTNWRIQEQHFPHATPIADLIHALSYAWSASKIDEGEVTYQKWAQLIWQGDVAEVIEHLTTLQSVHGKATESTPSDPRHHVDRALTYFTNNASRMSYPKYRQQGLPITSAHIESTVKLINRRIKGTEKFWDREASEAVLQLRADYLSDSKPMDGFWRRYHANQNGSNAYKASPRTQTA